MLAADELTVLMSWAEAAAEALALAPERIEAVTADAQAGAPWRAELRICEPSRPLSHAINDIFHAVRTAAATGGNPPLRPSPSQPTKVSRVSQQATSSPAQYCDQRSNNA